MIKVTRLNGAKFSLNALYIETVESFPDTTITLTTGKKYVVLDKSEDVLERIQQFYKEIHILSNPYVGGVKEDEE